MEHFPFVDKMESRYNRVLMTNSCAMGDKLREQGLEKLKEESAFGPMNVKMLKVFMLTLHEVISLWLTHDVLNCLALR